MRKPTKKLTLSIETIRRLNGIELSGAHGGAPAGYGCTKEYSGCGAYTTRPNCDTDGFTDSCPAQCGGTHTCPA